jgi:hypothetical protein
MQTMNRVQPRLLPVLWVNALSFIAVAAIADAGHSLGCIALGSLEPREMPVRHIREINKELSVHVQTSACGNERKSCM